MWIHQFERPDKLQILKNIPEPPLLPCHKCGKPMEGALFAYDPEYDPNKEGWEVFVGARYRCAKFHLGSSNPDEYFAHYNGTMWNWYRSACVD